MMHAFYLNDEEAKALVELVEAARGLRSSQETYVATATIAGVVLWNAKAAQEHPAVAKDWAVWMGWQRQAQHAVDRFLFLAPDVRLPTDPGPQLLGLAALVALTAAYSGTWGAPGRSEEERRSWWLAELLFGPQHPDDTDVIADELRTGRLTYEPINLLESLHSAIAADPRLFASTHTAEDPTEPHQ